MVMKQQSGKAAKWQGGKVAHHTDTLQLCNPATRQPKDFPQW